MILKVESSLLLLFLESLSSPTLCCSQSEEDSDSVVKDRTGLLGGGAKPFSELQLISAQYTHLMELLRMQLIREQIRHVMRLQNAVLGELEQDEDVLPISVWKKAVSCGIVTMTMCWHTIESLAISQVLAMKRFFCAFVDSLSKSLQL